MNEFIDFLRLNILVSLPQTYIYWVFCFSFLEVRPHKIFLRIALLTLVHSAYTDALILVLPLHLHFVNSLAAGLILLFIIFKEISIKKKLFLMFFTYFIGIVLDIITGAIAFYIFDISLHSDMIRDELYRFLPFIYLQLLFLLFISWVNHKRRHLSAKRIFSFIMESERNTLTKVIVLIGFQFVLLGMLQFIVFTPNKNNQTLHAILIYTTILVSLLALVSIIRLLIRTREQAVRMTQEVYVEEINDMFTSIRGQRHDFLNHVQVIHTMVQMGRTEQLKSYVSDLVKETRDVTEIVHHSSPALAAFVQAKMTVAIGKGITFTYELPEDWNVQETTVKVIDVIKIMGNLVDNAFDETESLPADQRMVHASIQFNGANQIELKVTNHGRTLDSTTREHIFSAGFTTKGEGHSGLGLAIVQERVKHYNGELSLQSDEHKGTTEFRITLPITAV